MVIDFSNFSFPGQLDRLFEEFSKPYLSSSRRMAYPPMNVSEDGSAFYVRAEIPGVNIGEIDLTLADKSLILKGERRVEQGKYFRQERPTGSFQRIVRLGVEVDRDKVSATMKDGVLTVTLPKRDATQRPKKIDINVG